jgi:hypothetical protein
MTGSLISGYSGGQVTGLISSVLGNDYAPDSEPRPGLHEQLCQPDPLRLPERQLSQGFQEDHLLQIAPGSAQPSRANDENDESRQLRRHIVGECALHKFSTEFPLCLRISALSNQNDKLSRSPCYLNYTYLPPYLSTHTYLFVYTIRMLLDFTLIRFLSFFFFFFFYSILSCYNTRAI